LDAFFEGEWVKLFDSTAPGAGGKAAAILPGTISEASSRHEGFPGYTMAVYVRRDTARHGQSERDQVPRANGPAYTGERRLGRR
jgi:hypothetical protein